MSAASTISRESMPCDNPCDPPFEASRYSVESRRNAVRKGLRIAGNGLLLQVWTLVAVVCGMLAITVLDYLTGWLVVTGRASPGLDDIFKLAMAFAYLKAGIIFVGFGFVVAGTILCCFVPVQSNARLAAILSSATFILVFMIRLLTYPGFLFTLSHNSTWPVVLDFVFSLAHTASFCLFMRLSAAYVGSQSVKTFTVVVSVGIGVCSIVAFALMLSADTNPIIATGVHVQSTVAIAWLCLSVLYCVAWIIQMFVMFVLGSAMQKSGVGITKGGRNLRSG